MCYNIKLISISNIYIYVIVSALLHNERLAIDLNLHRKF